MRSNDSSLRGRRVLVTGASSGIGRLAARELVSRGASVSLLVRDARRGERTRRWIETTTFGVQAPEVLLCDLSDLDQVRRAAGEFRRCHRRLDVLVNNAGVLQRRRRLSPQGHEWTLAVNHLGPFLLTLSLLDLMPRGGRIVNVASVAHTRGRFDFDDMTLARGYSMWGAYARSKLANVLFTYELARRLAPRGIDVNALHPGTLPTGIARGHSRAASWLWKILTRFSGKVEEGSDAVVELAGDPDLEGTTGRYFYKVSEAESSPQSHDPMLQDALWRWSLEAVGLPEDTVPPPRPGALGGSSVERENRTPLSQ